METSTKLKLSSGARLLMTALALAALLTGLAPAMAQADDNRRDPRGPGQYNQRDRGHSDQRDRRHYDQRNHRRPGGYVYEHPRGYYMAPPPVYTYQPPPPPPVMEFVFPLHIR